MADQAARFLGRTNGYATTSAVSPDHLEAVTEGEQAALTEQARRKVLDDRIKRRQATSEEITRELGWVDARGRYLRRELKRLAR